MKVADVRTRVDAIRLASWDYEVAHGMEDALYRDVLAAVERNAGVPDHVRELAREALKSQEIEFPRYTA